MLFMLPCLSVNSIPVLELNGSVKLNNTYCKMKARAASVMLTFACTVWTYGWVWKRMEYPLMLWWELLFILRIIFQICTFFFFILVKFCRQNQICETVEVVTLVPQQFHCCCSCHQLYFSRSSPDYFTWNLVYEELRYCWMSCFDNSEQTVHCIVYYVERCNQSS